MHPSEAAQHTEVTCRVPEATVQYVGAHNCHALFRNRTVERWVRLVQRCGLVDQVPCKRHVALSSLMHLGGTGKRFYPAMLCVRVRGCVAAVHFAVVTSFLPRGITSPTTAHGLSVRAQLVEKGGDRVDCYLSSGTPGHNVFPNYHESTTVPPGTT